MMSASDHDDKKTSDLKLAEVFFKEFEHRNNSFWRLTRDFFLAQSAITTGIVYLLKEDMINAALRFGMLMLVMFLSLTVSALLLAESARMIASARAYRSIVIEHLTADQKKLYLISEWENIQFSLPRPFNFEIFTSAYRFISIQPLAIFVSIGVLFYGFILSCLILTIGSAKIAIRMV